MTTETIRTIRDGDPRMATLTLAQLLTSVTQPGSSAYLTLFDLAAMQDLLWMVTYQ